MKKTLLFFQSLLLVCLFSIVGASSAWAEEVTYTYTLAKGDFSSSVATHTSDGVTWTLGGTVASPSTSFIIDSNNRGMQFAPKSNITFTSDKSFGSISSIVVNAAMAKNGDGKLVVKIGNVQISDTISLTKTAENYTFTPTSATTGTVVIGLSSTTKSTYLNSLTVYYDNGVDVESTKTSLSYTTKQTLKQTKTLAAPTVTVADESGTAITGASVTWSSSNTSIATVDATSGLVTGVALGTATITASYAGNDTYGKSAASYEVEVVENVGETTTMDLSYAATDTAIVKQEGTLSAPTVTVTTKSGTVLTSPAITWASADASIATVDASTGVVTGVALGTTTITATFAANDTYGSSSASYKVMVVDKDGVHTLIFPATGERSKDVNGYTSLWTAKMGKGDAAYSYNIKCFSNYDNGWSYIRAGYKSGATSPYIANITPFNKYIESIAITVDKYTETTGDKFYYIISDNADFKTVKDSVAFTIKASTSAQTVTLKPTYPGKYIKIGGDMEKTSKNGTLEISKLVYTESTKAATTLTLSFTKETLGFKKTLTAPTATVTAADGTTIDGATVKWKSYNTDIATVDETTGEVSTVDLGTATIVALYAGDAIYQPATATYEVEVKSSAKVTTVTPSLTGQNQVKVGKTLTATATVTTEDGAIDDAAVTWSSSNTDVATVDEHTGVVTGVGVGTATITASFTGDNLSYVSSSASYTVIVGGLTFKHVDKVTSGRQYMLVGVATEGGNLYAIEGNDNSSKDFAYFNANSITPNADGTLTTNNNLNVFLLTGDDTDGYYLQQTADNRYVYTASKSGTTLYNSTQLTDTQSEAAKWNITSKGDGSMKFVNANYPDEYYLSLLYYTKTSIWELYNDTQANQGGIHLYELQSDETLYVQTDEAYATYYTEEAYIMPEGLKGSSVSDAADDGTLTLPYEYAAGDVVPAKTALLIKADAKGKYPIYGTFAAATTTVTTNLLHGVSADTKITHEDKRFILTYSTVEGTKTLGFYTTASGNMTVLANRAYLELTSAVTSPVAGFAIPDGQTTGIEAAQTAAAPSAIYTLSGTRVKSTTTEGLPAGIYIVDGKKVFVK